MNDALMGLSEKAGKLSGKLGCVSMVLAVVSFTARFNWRPVGTEWDLGIASDPPILGVYFALCGLVCFVFWFILKKGFQPQGGLCSSRESGAIRLALGVSPGGQNDEESKSRRHGTIGR